MWGRSSGEEDGNRGGPGNKKKKKSRRIIKKKKNIMLGARQNGRAWDLQSHALPLSYAPTFLFFFFFFTYKCNNKNV